MSKITDNMKEPLQQLGFTEKEAVVYLAFLEFGVQPASVIARKAKLPRPTVLFLCDHLLQKGYLRKSKRGRTQYFYVDITDLERTKLAALKDEESLLKTVIPALKKLRHPFTSPPKITLFEGLDGCRKAYSLLLDSKTEIHEFAAHHDLMKMGEKFMEQFIRERMKRHIFIAPICQDTPLHRVFKKLDARQKRKLFLFPKSAGELYSSIDIFDDNKVLILNLYHDAFGILIENREVAETLKTIHRLVCA